MPLRIVRPPRAEERVHPCEICGTDVLQREAFSFIVCMRRIVPGEHIAIMQCPSEQHWCCSHDHAMQAAHTCIDDHHTEQSLRIVAIHPAVTTPSPQLTAALAKQLTGVRIKASGIPSLPETCAICEHPLTTAYSVPVCYATPGINFASYVCDPDGNEHWCCSEDHAKQAAHACIEEHLHPHDGERLRHG